MTGGGAGLYLLVTIPALNEERPSAHVIRGVPRNIPGIGTVEVLVVDDGSTDGPPKRRSGRVPASSATRRSAASGGAFHSALTYGLEHGADLIVSLDADGQFNPADIPALIAPVVDGRGGVHHRVALQGPDADAADVLEPPVGQPADESPHLVPDQAAVL